RPKRIPGRGAGRRPLPAVHRRRLRGADLRAAGDPDAHALRLAAARGGRRSAGRGRAGHPGEPGVPRDLRRRLGPRGAGRCARRRGAGNGSDVPVEVHGLLPDRRRGRRHQLDHRAAARGAAAGDRRRVRQVLRAEARCLRRLPADDRAAAVPTAGVVREGARAMTPAAGAAEAMLARSARVRGWEIAVWAAIAVGVVALPRHALLVNEIAILALFALSLDLVLGYAGLVSLGHAAFFGLGAYAAALFAKHVDPDPLAGLALATVLAAVLGAACSSMIVRGTDLTRLMVTMGVALVLYELANRFDGLTGGADGLQGVVMGPLLGRFDFDLVGRVASAYSLATLFAAFVVVRRVVHSPFGWSLRALRDNRLRVGAIGLSVNARLAAAYTLGAALAGTAGALLAQTTGFASLD